MFSVGDNKIEARATNGYLDTGDIMEILEISRPTVYGLFNSGKLKSDSDSYPGSRQRKKVEIAEFKRFLINNPKYYALVYGEPIEFEDKPEVEESKPEVKNNPDILTELFSKVEDVELLISEHEKEIEKLKAQKEALESVIDMF